MARTTLFIVCLCVTRFFDVYSDDCYDKQDKKSCKDSLDGNRCMYLKRGKTLGCGCKNNDDCSWQGYKGKRIRGKCDNDMQMCKSLKCKYHSECPQGYYCTVDIKPVDKYLRSLFKTGDCVPTP